MDVAPGHLDNRRDFLVMPVQDISPIVEMTGSFKQSEKRAMDKQ